MLSSVRILDLTWVLGGPFAGQLLAQLGAEVIKVETFAGDSARGIPPFFEGDSGFFLSINRGKKSISIDLKHPEGKAAFADLVRHSDAVMYSFTPDVPKRLGIDFGSLSRINPRICVAELIGLHDEGEFEKAPAYDVIVQAMGGVMSITGEPGGSPARVGYQIGDLAAGLYLALSLVSAITASRSEGKGRRVQVSLLDCQLALLTWQAQNYFITGTVPSAVGSRNAVLAPSEAFLCSDGRYLAVSPTGAHFWSRFCEILGRPDIPKDPRFETRAARISNTEELSAIFSGIFIERPAKVWYDRFFAEQIPIAIVLNVAEALTQPVADLRSMVELCVKPQSGTPLKFVGSPFKYAGATPLAYPPGHAVHTRSVLKDVCGYSDAEVNRLIDQRAVFSVE